MELCIDAADDRPGVALAVDGVVRLMLSWETRQNHSKELLPNIDGLLAEADLTKADVSAVFVDVGPGGYAALRVGVSIAKGLAHGLGVPIVGVGRLELDAWGAAEEAGRDGRYVAVHRAGRGEVAWGVYRRDGDVWSESEAPSIMKAEDLSQVIVRADVVTGDVDDALGEAALAEVVARAGAAIVSSPRHRVVVLASLGHRRLGAGAVDDAEGLVPMYLRAPAIGPQR